MNCNPTKRMLQETLQRVRYFAAILIFHIFATKYKHNAHFSCFVNDTCLVGRM